MAVRVQAQTSGPGNRSLLTSALVLLASACMACRPELTQVAQQPPKLTDFILVQRPPPVVPVDIQPSRPHEAAVWVPGSWSWRGAAWSWKPGAWYIPPAGARWSPWSWTYQADGLVRFWTARWLGPDGQPIEDPLPVRGASFSVPH